MDANYGNSGACMAKQEIVTNSPEHFETTIGSPHATRNLSLKTKEICLQQLPQQQKAKWLFVFLCLFNICSGSGYGWPLTLCFSAKKVIEDEDTSYHIAHKAFFEWQDLDLHDFDEIVSNEDFKRFAVVGVTHNDGLNLQKEEATPKELENFSKENLLRAISKNAYLNKIFEEYHDHQIQLNEGQTSKLTTEKSRPTDNFVTDDTHVVNWGLDPASNYFHQDGIGYAKDKQWVFRTLIYKNGYDIAPFVFLDNSYKTKIKATPINLGNRILDRLMLDYFVLPKSVDKIHAIKNVKEWSVITFVSKCPRNFKEKQDIDILPLIHTAGLKSQGQGESIVYIHQWSIDEPTTKL